MRKGESQHKELTQRMELLYEQFYGRLYAYALPLMQDEEDTRDIVEEAMERVWSQWQQGTLQGQPTATYLYTITRNLCVSRLRHSLVHRHYAEVVSRTADIHDDNTAAEYEQRLERIRQKVEELSEPDHTIILNCYFRHMTYQQTADAMGISFVTVKKHIMKILKQWRKELKNEK